MNVKNPGIRSYAITGITEIAVLSQIEKNDVASNVREEAKHRRWYLEDPSHF